MGKNGKRYKKIFLKLSDVLDIQFDSLDINLFSLFFSTLRYTRKSKDIDGLIIAHGFATASSIANVYDAC